MSHDPAGPAGVCSPAPGGVRVRVRVTPKGGRDAVEGVEATAQGPALKVRVRAAPQDGAANAALARTVADWLGVPKSCIEVAAGHKSRLKLLSICGEPRQLARRIEDRLAGKP